MKYLSYKYSPDIKRMYILPLSDTHFGDPTTNIKKLKGYLEWVREKDARIILNGDIFNLSDVAGREDADMLNPNEQLDIAVDIFYPYKDLILGVTEGNHDRKLRKETQFDIVHEFCQRLNIIDKYDRTSVLVKLSFGRDYKGRTIHYHLYTTHGWGAGRTKGSKVNNMGLVSTTFPLFDVYITSHSHFTVGYQDIIKIPRDNRDGEIIERKRTFISSGCFVNSEYGERLGYSAVKQGTVRVRLDGTRKDVHFSM